MNKRKIIVAGYPKSGNTWLTRLTAELIDCPVAGFLYSTHEEIAVEGKDRTSDFEVLKSHHQLSEIKPKDLSNAKIIYIIRDPRDVSISGRKFFGNSIKFFKLKNTRNPTFISKCSNRIKLIFNNLFDKIIVKRRNKLRMENAILNGDQRVHYWCRVSWKTHLTPYLANSNVLKVKYESVLENPLQECIKILQYLNIEKTNDEIMTTISNQSFEKKKEYFKKKGELDKYVFMKSGKKQQYRNVMSEKENQRYINALDDMLIELGYDLN